MTQETSLLAFAEVLQNLGERQKQVYKAIRELGSCNNTMIANHLKLPISSITPRVRELRKKRAVIYHKKDYCRFTGKLTMFWKVRYY